MYMIMRCTSPQLLAVSQYGSDDRLAAHTAKYLIQSWCRHHVRGLGTQSLMCLSRLVSYNGHSWQAMLRWPILCCWHHVYHNSFYAIYALLTCTTSSLCEAAEKYRGLFSICFVASLHNNCTMMNWWFGMVCLTIAAVVLCMCYRGNEYAASRGDDNHN